jgi:hypothetical protein
MSKPDLAAFDPYAQWLGIPPAEQPPDHYRLLGLARFETDPARIAAAADARMALLRSVQTGPRGLIAQKIMNEVAAARVCLLAPERKSLYDKELWQRLAAQTRPSATLAPQSPGIGAMPMPTFAGTPHTGQPLAAANPMSGAALLATPTHDPQAAGGYSATPCVPIVGGPASAGQQSASEIPLSVPVSGVRYRRRRALGTWIWVIATGLAVAGLAALAYVLSQKSL